MKYQNSLTIFIYLLVAELFLYFTTNLFPTKFFGPYGDLAFTVLFSATLLGFFLATYKETTTISKAYYYILWIVSLVFIYLYMFHKSSVFEVIKYYFVLAVLVALLISVIDHKRVVIYHRRAVEEERMRRVRDQEKYHKELADRKNEIQEKENHIASLRDYNQKLKELNHDFIIETGEKQALLREKEEKLALLKQETDFAARHVMESLAAKEELEAKANLVREQKKKIEDAKVKILELESVALQLKRELGKTRIETEKKNQLKGKLAQQNNRIAEEKQNATRLENEIIHLKKTLGKTRDIAEKQEELKSKYSKSLRNLRKTKKEEESILVISPDGNSVHKPNCIVVRNIAKDHRKLIPDWKQAKKAGYTGCKLCKPDRFNETIIKNDIKYRYVASIDSDKLHTVSCTLVERIKDRQYFKTYRQAVKKGYTPCRVCNPSQ